MCVCVCVFEREKLIESAREREGDRENKDREAHHCRYRGGGVGLVLSKYEEAVCLYVCESVCGCERKSAQTEGPIIVAIVGGRLSLFL